MTDASPAPRLFEALAIKGADFAGSPSSSGLISECRLRDGRIRNPLVRRQQTPISIAEFLVGLDALAKVAGSAQELQIAELVAAVTADRPLVVNLKLPVAHPATAIPTATTLFDEQRVSHVRREDDSSVGWYISPFVEVHPTGLVPKLRRDRRKCLVRRFQRVRDVILGQRGR